MKKKVRDPRPRVISTGSLDPSIETTSSRGNLRDPRGTCERSRNRFSGIKGKLRGLLPLRVETTTTLQLRGEGSG